jgi:hypothetical protein
MTTADEHGSATGGIGAGFFSFTEITDPGAHPAYNAWHQLDHLPEQMPLAGIAHGERWVVSPRCLAARDFASAELAGAHYLTCYLMRPPFRETIESFYALAMRLHDADRFFAHRRAIATAALKVQGAYAAPRVRVSPAAIPYRPNRGVYAVVERGRSELPGEDLSGQDRGAVPAGRIDELLRLPGVAGVWTFGQTVSASETPGSDRSLDARVTICYLDDDPLQVSGAIGDLLRPDWEREERSPDMAGPLEAITPWCWDWFDEQHTERHTELHTRPTTEGDE